MRYLALAILVPFGVFAFAACGDDSHQPPANPPPGDAGPADPGQAARAAVLLGSCVPDDGVHRYLSDIYYAHIEDPFGRTLFKDNVACLATKNNGCQAVSECTGIVIDIANDCQPGCDGQRATNCDDQLRVRVDCARYGMECRFQDRAAACALPGAKSCSELDGGENPACVDGRPRDCDSYVEEFGPKCADFALTCSNRRCAGTEGACEYGFLSDPQRFEYTEGVECTNGMLKTCVNGGLATIACSSLSPDFTCQQRVLDGGKTIAYCGLGAACDAPRRQNLTCEGDSVVVCNAGRIDKVDCKSLGFTGCDARLGGCVPNLE
ncbi:hypothetical protein LVJ94_01660 [Pendulispora rubella]|uniref:Dickkopf N-terminal cysteine-rich domain-containing protein n=1 Tax=Pendulispora rubella TaxID=2741070 RepID=A0ABZ2L9V8_9BACT